LHFLFSRLDFLCLLFIWCPILCFWVVVVLSIFESFLLCFFVSTLVSSKIVWAFFASFLHCPFTLGVLRLSFSPDSFFPSVGLFRLAPFSSCLSFLQSELALHRLVVSVPKCSFSRAYKTNHSKHSIQLQLLLKYLSNGNNSRKSLTFMNHLLKRKLRLANVKLPICAEVSFLTQALGALRFFRKEMRLADNNSNVIKRP